jgi:hypothetical protein
VSSFRVPHHDDRAKIVICVIILVAYIPSMYKKRLQVHTSGEFDMSYSLLYREIPHNLSPKHDKVS